MEQQREGWALVKRGLYWRPDGKGYTGLKCEAGFYTDEQAMGYSDHGDGTTKVRWADAPELSPSCSTETALKHFTSRALTAERLLAEARAGLRDLLRGEYGQPRQALSVAVSRGSHRQGRGHPVYRRW